MDKKKLFLFLRHLHTTNYSWHTCVGKLKLVCIDKQNLFLFLPTQLENSCLTCERLLQLHMYNFVSQGTHSSPSRRNSDNNKVEVCGSLSRENTRFFQRFAVFQHEFANFSLSCVAFRAENSKRTEAVTFEILRFLIYFRIRQPVFCCLNGPIVPYICIVSIRLGWNAS